SAVLFYLFFFSCYCDSLNLPSFPTRRSSDLSFSYADCGVIAVSNGIIVHNDLVREDPALIRAFVSASLKGFLYGREHLDEMIARSEEHTSELQSPYDLVCRLLLEKKKAIAKR